MLYRDENRALATACKAMANMAIAAENQVAMYNNGVLMTALLNVIKSDEDGARVAACTALQGMAYLAENRVAMCKNAVLMTALLNVIKSNESILFLATKKHSIETKQNLSSFSLARYRPLRSPCISHPIARDYFFPLPPPPPQ
jgi:hypothetical protein